MKTNNRWIILLLLGLVTLLLSACGATVDEAAGKSEKPAELVEIAGSEFKGVKLTQRAAERTGIEVSEVTEAEGEMVVPYSTIIYGLHGETWLYTNPDSLTYVRYPVTVDRIEGGLAFLSEGPTLGTTVVTVGVAELYGEETGIKK